MPDHLPIVAKAEARAEYRKLHLILELKSDEFEPCHGKIVETGRIWKKKYLVHLKLNGEYEWNELP